MLFYEIYCVVQNVIVPRLRFGSVDAGARVVYNATFSEKGAYLWCDDCVPIVDIAYVSCRIYYLWNYARRELLACGHVCLWTVNADLRTQLSTNMTSEISNHIMCWYSYICNNYTSAHQMSKLTIQVLILVLIQWMPYRLFTEYRKPLRCFGRSHYTLLTAFQRSLCDETIWPLRSPVEVIVSNTYYNLFMQHCAFSSLYLFLFSHLKCLYLAILNMTKKRERSLQYRSPAEFLLTYTVALDFWL